MSELLYLDTARLGRMTPGARRAHLAFADLAGEEGGSAYFLRFLTSGLAALPTGVGERYAGLSGWRGVGPLKESLLRLTGKRADLPVLLANRSAQVMKLTARVLFHTCRNVLVTDLDWPGYREVLAAVARRSNRLVTVAPVRRALVDERIGEDELVERLETAFARNRCDGLFLTAVSSDGIRLPIGHVVRALESAHRVWFVGVDGAQDFCHAGADLRYCDLYLTGAHKWLGAYHPLGVGFYGRRRSRKRVETVMAHMIRSGDLDDPLLRYCARPESDPVGPIAETVNVAPLFSCQGAVDDALALSGADLNPLTSRLDNGEAATEPALRAGWCPVSPTPAMRSGILMLRPENALIARHDPVLIREAFRERGISLSTYPEGRLRLSMPAANWTDHELTQLSDGLRAVNNLFG